MGSPHATEPAGPWTSFVRTLQMCSSTTVGWLADRRIPGPLRSPVYRTYCRITGADPSEARHDLSGYPSLGAFFVRELVPGARPFPEDTGLLPSPVDGAVTSVSAIEGEEERAIQAKGQAYGVRELLAGIGTEVPLAGGLVWTLYLSPRDYHRIHAPLDGRLVAVRWVDGMRWKVGLATMGSRVVLPRNERCVLRFETEHGPYFLVFVGALNVGRIRVTGIEPGTDGDLARPREVRRGAEVGRFEMGSTVVIVTPQGMARPSPWVVPGLPLRMGSVLGRLEGS